MIWAICQAKLCQHNTTKLHIRCATFRKLNRRMACTDRTTCLPSTCQSEHLMCYDHIIQYAMGTQRCRLMLMYTSPSLCCVCGRTKTTSFKGSLSTWFTDPKEPHQGEEQTLFQLSRTKPHRFKNALQAFWRELDGSLNIGRSCQYAINGKTE